ncbi:MAG: tetratricopeptide repeat protein, partial [Candidatus Limnocylindrales bacterium]
GIDPGPELQALEMAVLRQDPSLDAGPPGGTRAGNLPMPPSALVGRSAELASAKRQLAGPTRLLTLTGPGGIGKTRLALEIAWALADDVDGGAWFVDLEGATTPAAALSTIGSALGLPEVAEDDLLASLRDRTTGALLLVLDNLEQVPEIAGPLAELLAASPALRILATSRTPLQIRAEREHPLPPLATGGNGAGVPSDAVALFLERARAVDPSFDPGPAGLADVGRLCERLDGLPLAIELAAARVRLLSPAAILVRVEHSLDVLRSERRDLPGRQRSLEAAITWSFDLLTDTERRVFVPAAVFAGGFTLQAFEAVCAEPGDDALNLLEGLLRHSLVRRRDGQSGEPRFALLDTIRRFALDRLEHGADREVQARHGQYMTELAARLESSIGEPDETELILELREEHDNFVAALAWLESSGDDTAFVALAAASAPYWVRDSRYREGLGWIATALDRTSGGTPADRARLLRHRAALSSTQGDGRAALGYAMASVKAWEIVGDQHGLADALRVVAMTAADLGDLDAAGAAATRALSVAEAAGDPRLARDARHELAHVAVQRGDLAVGLQLLQANVDVLRRSGSRASLAATLGNLGMIHMEMGNLDQAEAVARESITMVRTLHDDANLASILTTLAEILSEQGRLEEAEACGRESLVAVLRAGAMRELPPILEMMGRINALRGDHGTAVRMVAVARSVRDAGAAPGQGPEVDALAPGARDALGEDAFEAAWRAGLATSPDQLLEELIGTGLAQEGVRTAAGPDQDRSGEPAAGGDRGHAHGEHEDAGAGKESQPEEALRRHHRGSVPS